MPIISLKHKFIIVLNPKCASTYLERVFKNFNDYPNKIYKHHKASMIKKILEEDGYNFDDFFVVLVIRNPIEHAISAYYQDLILFTNNKGKNKEKFIRYKNDINSYINNEKLRHYPGLLQMMADKNQICLVDKIFKINELNLLIKLFEKKYNITLEKVNHIVNKKKLELFEHNYQVFDLDTPVIKKLKTLYNIDFLFFDGLLYYQRNENIIKLG